MALFHIKNFSCHMTLILKRKLQQVDHKWVICGSHPDCYVHGLVAGSNGSTGVTHFQPDVASVFSSCDQLSIKYTTSCHSPSLSET